MAKDKREVQKVYRKKSKSRIYTLQIFSAMVYLLMEKYRISDRPVVIDLEYMGQEDLIKSYILQLVRKRHVVRLSSHDMGFFRIGKSSNAHKLAIEDYRRNLAGHVVGKNELFKLIFLYDS